MPGELGSAGALLRFSFWCDLLRSYGSPNGSNCRRARKTGGGGKGGGGVCVFVCVCVCVWKWRTGRECSSQLYVTSKQYSSYVFIVFIVFIVFHYMRTCTSYACLYVRAYSSTPIGYYYSPRSAQESIP